MSRPHIEDEVNQCKNSVLRLMVGDCIGTGSSRHVYEIRHDPTLVLKIEHTGRTFHNQMEWSIWQDVENWPIADWFAPCVDVDSYGNALVQKRTQPFETEQDFKIALQRTRGGVIPDVFCDIHYGNFGMLNGVVTCHDYGYHGFFEKVARSLSIDAGYITFDQPETTSDRRIWHDGGQYELGL